MVISMRSPRSRCVTVFLTLSLAILAATPPAHAAPQENPSGDPQSNPVCSNLGVYIFVGGTAGFDALVDRAQFKELLKTGHVGLYEHANAIIAAEKSPGLMRALEHVFSGTAA